MELDEMKNAWQEMTGRATTREIITNQLLEQMTQEKYRSKISKIGSYEYMGSIVCYLGASYLLAKFSKIGDPIMQVFAIIAILLLFALPVISIRSVYAVRKINLSSTTYLEAIKDFGKRKIRFQKLQKLNVSLGLFLMLIGLPVLAAIQGKDITRIPYFWTVIFPLAVAFFLAFAFWTLRSYNRILEDTEKMLGETNC